MSQHEEWLTAREQLRRSPTVDRWEKEIEEILQGGREHLLQDTDSASEYVDALLQSSEDYATSKTCFREALYRVVEAWQPSAAIGQELTIHLFDLIAAYTPTPGSTKLIEFILHHADFGTSAPDDYISSLIDSSLRALQGYYPGPPDDWQISSFHLYIDLLTDALEDLRYCGYALTRLVAIGIYKVDDSSVRERIANYPKVLKDLVSYWLGLANIVAGTRALTELYDHCLSLDLQNASRPFLAQFEDALAHNRASLHLDESLDPTVMHLGRVFHLRLSLLSNPSVRAFKRHFLDPLLSNPIMAGRAIRKMLSEQLVKESDGEVRDAIHSYPTTVLTELVSHGRGLTQDEAISYFSVILTHCLSLDEEAGSDRFVTVLKESLEKHELKLEFMAHGETISLQVRGRDFNLPLPAALESKEVSMAAWRMLTHNAMDVLKSLD